MRRIERKVYYKLKFSMGEITSDDTVWIREAMERLEQEPVVMKCFQNTSQTVFGDQARWNDLSGSIPDFTIYYRNETVDAIDRFLFKMKLRFPNCVVDTTQTLQEHF